ncbi:hypothetical protein ACFVXC_07440 [Streptomyces sp. NPDC058257]|uniref:hypothetical protein n=1 Tax=Streptomyces sp. NPDC058257 TaxID=3346409 RepID=UPI0036E87EAB
MRATRRTFRTAAIATGAIAALAVPTTAAFAADTPPNPQGQIAPDDQTGTTGQDQDQGQDKSKDQDQGTDQNQGTDQDKGTDTDTETPKPGSWESKGTTDLGKGWSAKVDVNASARTAKASISHDGAAKGSLTAYEDSASTTIDGNTFTLTPDGTVTAKLVDKGKDKEKNKDKDKDKPVPGGWVSKGTTDLGKGWSAKVDVNASARTAKASISHDGAAKGSLKAYVKPSSTKIDGSTFTLAADGTITRTGAKPTPPKPQPKPTPDHKRTLVHQYANLGGTGFDAKVYKTRSGYEADMIAKAPETGKKIVWDTLKQSGNKPAYGQHNGAHFVLNPDGTMKGWTGGQKSQPQTHTNPNASTNTNTNTQPKNGTSHVVPKGGVKAGAEGVHPAGESAPLMAAGGGMAALGAAGLGFALYRRKQDN